MLESDQFRAKPDHGQKIFPDKLHPGSGFAPESGFSVKFPVFQFFIISFSFLDCYGVL